MRLFFYVRRIGFSLLWRPDERTENPRDDNLLLCCASRPFPSPSSVRPSSALDGVPTPGAMVHTVLMAISPVDNTSSLPSPLGPLPPSPARQAIPLSFPPRALSLRCPPRGSLPLCTVCPSPSFPPRAFPFYPTARAPPLSFPPSVPPICTATLALPGPPRRSIYSPPPCPFFFSSPIFSPFHCSNARVDLPRSPHLGPTVHPSRDLSPPRSSGPASPATATTIPLATPLPRKFSVPLPPLHAPCLPDPRAPPAHLAAP